MPNTINAKSATAHRRGSRDASDSGTTATADHSSAVLKWFGCRMLPTARPSSPERAIHCPSAQSAANTCTMPISVPNTPATIQATKKACSAALPARDPAETSSADAASSPSAERLRPAGSEPHSHDHRTQAAITPCAARSGPVDDAPFAGAESDPVIATTAPQSASAAS